MALWIVCAVLCLCFSAGVGQGAVTSVATGIMYAVLFFCFAFSVAGDWAGEWGLMDDVHGGVDYVCSAFFVLECGGEAGGGVRE